jgi:hypothetical protein
VERQQVPGPQEGAGKGWQVLYKIAHRSHAPIR